MTPVNVMVVGSGYVGTVVAACLASIGHRVTGLEADEMKLSVLRAGRAPFYEPGLDELVAGGMASGHLAFTDAPVAAADADVVFLCVGTPPGPDGRPDLSAVLGAATAVATHLTHRCVFVTKSTVPIGSNTQLESLIQAAAPSNGDRSIDIAVASNPEFLREGNAVLDFLHPDRVVLGSASERALDVLEQVYRPILDQRVGGGRRDRRPGLVRTDLATAETIKYASNAFLATKVSFINEISRICDEVGADVVDVARGIGLDDRIGDRFLDAGIGWGGSCFGKDIDALVTTAADRGVETRILRSAREVNAAQRADVIERIQRHLGSLTGSRIALLGLAFKPDTDDLRDAPSLDVARRAHEQGATVVAHDPAVSVVPGEPIEVVGDPLEAVTGADAVVVVTDWAEYAHLDLGEVARRMRGRLFFDGRNMFEPEDVRAAGLVLEAFGRGRARVSDLAEA